MPVIQTQRLLLREFLPADWEAVNPFLSDPEITRYTHFASYDETQRRAWFNWCLENDKNPERDAYHWAIALPDTNLVIGWLGIGSPSQPRMVGERDFGYVLNRAYWNQGYEFRELGALRIFATCELPNVASARVMEKVGMRHEGTFYDSDFEGNWANRHRYGISREEFSQT